MTLNVVAILLCLAVVGNGLRLRRRVTALTTLEPSAEPVDGRHRFVVATGIEVDAATRRAASAFARAHGLAVLDLVPADLRMTPALDLARSVDPRTYRADRLAPGRGGCHALLVDADVLERAGVERVDGLGPVGLAALTGDLKRFASADTALAVAPGLRAARVAARTRSELLRASLGWWAPYASTLAAISYVALAGAAALRPVLGLVAVGIWVVQPYLILARTQVSPRDLHWGVLTRVVRDPVLWLRACPASWRSRARSDLIALARPAYERELAAGWRRFLEPRRDTCPWCGGTELRRKVVARDLIQHKPGRFVLEECRSCRHVFQNPRLSPDGLAFYYRDFYDGLGAEDADTMFGRFAASQYPGRIELVRRAGVEPRAWLDVGAGHGHFCNVARGTWPEAEFAGLDLNEGVVEGVRRGWLDRSYRGMFPDLAGDLAGRFDVVSMHHYLEHTREPFAELDAAARVLPPGGHLLIEMPNSASRFGRVLGRWWLPWFQPQHQHMMPVGRLEQALAERGLRPVAREVGPTHQRLDLTAALLLGVDALVPAVDWPWRPRPTLPRRAVRMCLKTAVVPLVVVAVIGDMVLGLALRNSGGGNAYRVLARRA